MKKIVLVDASPRQGGNSEIVVDTLAEALAGCEVTVFKMREKDCRFCRACAACQGKETQMCVQRDDITALLPVIDQCDAIVKATKVDGIYDKDPAKYPDAVKFSTITFDETLNRHIGVMDATAFALLRDNKVPIIVCRMLGGDILKAVKGESVGTIVTG